MAHFAMIDENSFVVRVIVIDDIHAPDPAPDNSESKGVEYILKLAENDSSLSGKWLQTSYNKNFRKNFASIGFYYAEDIDMFLTPKPYNSWNYDSNGEWQAPVPMPEEGGPWIWNEELLDWEKDLIEEELTEEPSPE